MFNLGGGAAKCLLGGLHAMVFRADQRTTHWTEWQRIGAPETVVESTPEGVSLLFVSQPNTFEVPNRNFNAEKSVLSTRK